MLSTTRGPRTVYADWCLFKAANVLIHEEGRLELCDFGVANVLDTRTDKRRTFIGTLHWMPPELWTEKPEYSDEVWNSDSSFVNF